MTEELFELAPNELLTRNLANDPDAVDSGGVSVGIVGIEANGPITADYFQVDEAGDFATGDQALDDNTLCSDWQARFLRFGADDAEGTQLTFLLNGPLGGDSEVDPPTITGETFDEAGNLVNTFAVFTSEWLIRVSVLDAFVIDTGPDFGTLRLTLDTEFSGGAVFERHTAFGRFSVGTLAFCRTPTPVR